MQSMLTCVYQLDAGRDAPEHCQLLVESARGEQPDVVAGKLLPAHRAPYFLVCPVAHMRTLISAGTGYEDSCG